ncbi:hypothetical protein BOTBODRAFT_134985 [Botryobasidium botryosum FD-172 SS1]|uniref:NADP-dependent oxidoreductase domain-containing protein n=1 Tax=Botryobasidium botryosum (strain FD-172 SS1) TaxID=930990 RepID=A0A067M8H9_BOTB1|nr:hypothetical protein BOTBODRAFT_134985 [Botryobasidium botryosum FD-172 SS1]
MGIGGVAYGSAGSDDESFKVFDRLFELGCIHWDTADAYGGSEAIIGKWFKRTGNRSKIFLATKFGFTPDYSINGSAEYVKKACDQSLAKLDVDYIDLYYLHRVDTTVPIEITVGAMAELVKEGKVKYIGLSEPSPATLRRAHAVHKIAAVQVEYSPLIFDIEKNGLLDTARELGVAVVAYSPLGRGLLTGQFKSHSDFAPDDFRRTVPKFSESNFPTILDLSKQLKSIGSKHGESVTPGQVALAWLLAQGDDIIPIPGSKRISYMEENLGARNLQLSSSELQAIRDAMIATEKNLPEDKAPEFIMNLNYQDTPPLPVA